MPLIIISKEHVKRDHRRIETLISRVCRNDIIKKVLKNISAKLGFVKCHEWRVACNRRGDSFWSHAAGGLCRSQCLYDVTTIPTSVYVVSLIKVLLSCSRVLTAVCNTIWLNTDAISIDITIRRQCVATTGPVRLSVSDLPPQGLQASRQSLMGHQGVKIFDNPKKSILSKR